MNQGKPPFWSIPYYGCTPETNHGWDHCLLAFTEESNHKSGSLDGGAGFRPSTVSRTLHVRVIMVELRT